MWKQANGKPAPAAALSVAQAASIEFAVPVGILLGTVERESNFRLGLVSSAGAVGPCQFKPKYAQDYYRYASTTQALRPNATALRGMIAGGSRCWRTGTARTARRPKRWIPPAA